MTKISSKFLYRTVKAIRFYASLFDINTGASYKLVTTNNLTKSGYFLIKQVDDGKWLVLKEVPTHKIEHYNQLPYLTRIRLYQFLSINYGFSREIQKIIDSLDL